MLSITSWSITWAGLRSLQLANSGFSGESHRLLLDALLLDVPAYQGLDREVVLAMGVARCDLRAARSHRKELLLNIVAAFACAVASYHFDRAPDDPVRPASECPLISNPKRPA
jgi:hypothetical protein